jgi:hypothetical protein
MRPMFGGQWQVSQMGEDKSKGGPRIRTDEHGFNV